MKIAIATLGTRGDLQPYIALGLGLQEAGYEVLIISSQNEEHFVRRYGLKFFALSVDIEKLMEGDDVKEMAKGSNPVRFIISHLKGSNTYKELMVVTQAEIWVGCLDADIIVFHPGLPIGFFMAKELKKISVLASPFPIVPTKDYPSILFYSGPRLGTFYNLVTHTLFDTVFWLLSKSAVKTFWNSIVKSRLDFSTSPVRQQIKSGMPVLNCYSKRLFPESTEWPQTIHTTGSWSIDKEPAFTPPPDLVDFINDGQPPIYIGFGSMKDADTFVNTLEMIVNALQQTKQRAVVGLGWSRLPSDRPIPKEVFLVDSVPHTWLFPQMKLVVHHGGAGTTATGLAAGKPTIIIPHNADQPAWGQRVCELGVGAKPIKKSNLTAANLAAAINYALKPEIIEKASQLGQQLSKEHGVQNAVEVINEYVVQNRGK